MIKFQILMLWPSSTLQIWKLAQQSPEDEFLFLSRPCGYDVNPIYMRHASKLKWQPKVVKSLELFLWLESNGWQTLVLRAELWVTTRCSSRRNFIDREEHSSPGFWIFRCSALWVVPNKIAWASVAIADRPCSHQKDAGHRQERSAPG